MSVTTHSTLTQYQARGRASVPGVSGLLATIKMFFATWRRRVQEREAFARLDQRDLRDMGLSQWEVEREIAKPFWRE